MRIATFNVNGVNGRLPVLLRWLAEAQPDVACLQELKAPQEKFPIAAIRDAGYGAIWLGQKSWNGVAILARGRGAGSKHRRGLPGDPDDSAQPLFRGSNPAVSLIGCLYLPNGNPAPGPKFDYKLRWFERLVALTPRRLLAAWTVPVVLAGDYNVIPTELDVYKPERWHDDALFRPEVRRGVSRMLVEQGLDRCSLRKLHPDERLYTFWDYFRNAWGRDAGLRIDHLLLEPGRSRRRLRGRRRPSRGARLGQGKRPCAGVDRTCRPRARPRRIHGWRMIPWPRTIHSILQRFADGPGARFSRRPLRNCSSGRKRTHWMWFIFPQLRGLGQSQTALFYGIASRDEARAYLDHPVLGPRLDRCTRAVLDAHAASVHAIFGSPDDMKFRSSMTLFDAVSDGAGVFRQALDRWCGGAPDERTLKLLGQG